MFKKIQAYLATRKKLKPYKSLLKFRKKELKNVNKRFNRDYERYEIERNMQPYKGPSWKRVNRMLTDKYRSWDKESIWLKGLISELETVIASIKAEGKLP